MLRLSRRLISMDSLRICVDAAVVVLRLENVMALLPFQEATFESCQY